MDKTSAARQLIIDIIGQAGAGKTTLVTHLAEKYGFYIYSPSNAIRAYAHKHGEVLRDRTDYVNLHRVMHRTRPCPMVAPLLASTEPLIVADGLRVQSHVKELQAQGMLIIALTYPPSMTPEEWAYARFERVRKSAPWRQYRDASNIHNLEQFVSDEAVDNGHADPDEPDVDRVVGWADITLDASQPLEQVLAAADEQIGRLLQQSSKKV